MSEIRRILHVIATMDRGGTEVSCLGLTQALDALGVENRLAAIRAGERGIVAAFDDLVPEIEVLPQGRWARMRAFADLLRRDRPDAVIFHLFTIEHVLLSLIARCAGMRRLAVVQGNPASTTPDVRRKSRMILAATRLLKGTLISASSWIERSMVELGRLPDGSTIIHTGCDTMAIAARAAQARADADPTEAVILMIARLDPIKDHATLIRAFAKLPEFKNGRQTVLELAGSGVLQDQLIELAESEGVADRVRFLGAQQDISGLLGRSTVFCLSTTRDEGFGVVLIEALAASTPVVATDVPACAEVLEDGRLGVLVPPDDADALAVALEAALIGGSKKPELAQVAERYDISTMALSYLSVLKEQD